MVRRQFRFVAISPLLIGTAAAGLSACAQRVPGPSGLPQGTPRVSWIIMYGDRDTPDREFACQSDPRSQCVVPASRPDNDVFSDVHIYYHSAGGDTTYEGSVLIGFFRGASPSTSSQTRIAVNKNESMARRSVIGLVTPTPGTYTLDIAVNASVGGVQKPQPVEAHVPVVVQ